MFNKILGVVLIAIGAFLALGFLVGLPGMFIQFMDTIADGSAYSWGAFFGYLVGSLVLGVIAFLLFRFGIKLFKKKSLTGS